MSSAPPQLIADRYRLIEPLGQGGMGRVWKARDEVLHRDVAIKELVPPPGLTEDERREMRERSLREARAIARLNHANVVRVFDVLRTDGDPWIVMEYIPSRSLQDALASDGPVSPARAAEIGLGVLGALKSAHRAGVMHRDVKPGNVLLGDDGRVVLTDFGLATVPGDPNVTRTGLVLGSPAYIAPERARDGTAGPEGDLWSLGATLYAAVEGQSPFARPSAIATLAALATEPPPVSRRAGPLKTVLAGLLRKDPANRINAEVAERLLRRASGRRRSPGMSLLDGVRRPGPNGPREPGEPRTRIVPLPAPRPAQERPQAAPATAPPTAVPSAADTTRLPEPPAAETTKLPAAPVDEVETVAARTADSPAPETGSTPKTPDSPWSPSEPAVVVSAGSADEGEVKSDPAPTAVQPKPDTAPTELVAPAAQPLSQTSVPTGRDIEYDEGGGNGRGLLVAVPAGNRRMWLLGGLVVLLLLALAVIVPLANGGSGEEDNVGTTGSAPAGAPTAATNATSTPTPAATTPSAQPSATPTGQPSQPQLPLGWRMHRDPTNFSVPVLEGWEMTREKTGPAADAVRVWFRDPNGPGQLLIDQTNRPEPDPVADWKSKEDYRRNNTVNYQRVRQIRAVDYWDKCADWDWLETVDGVRVHVRNRGFVTAPDKAYAIRWDTAADEWDENLPNFQLIVDGFRPARD
ncbi:serine/threonine-protein kinase [Plantactinospora sp. KLBMP9567]|uniref:serine/threonine-protein kinase n=1 Tax=Plantactinospora sp. KLBMP9567 TaxID=3085900 RepID=UPI0029821410|nr:protein kinase [Plantactinospora sp. KLBMP9567]MDW5326349.1 protein kinase [Plantactinospora sp. KLBMP9567]